MQKNDEAWTDTVGLMVRVHAVRQGLLPDGNLESFSVEVDDATRANLGDDGIDEYVFKRLVERFLSHHGGRVVPRLPRGGDPAVTG